MKYLVALLFSIVCFKIVNGQQFKNKTFNTFSFEYNMGKGKDEITLETNKQSKISASLSSGYFVHDKILIGFGIQYSYLRQSIDYSTGREEKFNEPQFRLSGAFSYFQQIAKSRFYYTPQISGFYYWENGRMFSRDPGLIDVITKYPRRGVGVEIKPLEFNFAISKRIFIGTGLASITLTKRRSKTIYSSSEDKESSTTLDVAGSAILSNFRLSLML